ncbi:DUF3810 domain-containing protein [Carboxylicivirga sp. N1Y90]|uniref:DUF3810 domain-containing protein n=1 Tax=Carboxylicivirga fragile TaxID=3417571 RepID=UPI003D33A0DA|nr:DUF3810 domain-containing protein [Marinilabiliaceae bacterium N1Y90]
MKVKKNTYLSLFVYLLLTLTTFALTELAALYPEFIERTYSQGMYPTIAKLLSFFSTRLPFSLDDAFYALMVTWLMLLPLLAIFKRIRWKKVLLHWLGTLALVYVCFYWFWGFNYYRNDLETRLNFVEAKTDSVELMNVFRQLINECNQTYSQLDSTEYAIFCQLIEKEYALQADFLQIDADLCSTRPKNITLSRFFAAATIGGYYGPFFSEVHVNAYLLPMEYPAILAHELAHRYGITDESEANFYAWYVCSQTKDKRIQYSGHLHLLGYFLPHVYNLDGAEALLKTIRPEVKADYRRHIKHWRALMNREVEEVAHKVNDAYLKTNKVEGGIDDYDGVVKHVMDFYNTVNH